MDTGKIIKVIDDIRRDEKKYSFQNSLDLILSNYQQNAPEAVNKERDKVKQGSAESVINKYSLSDYKALKKLDNDDFFGSDLFVRLSNILSSQPHEVPTLLQAFISSRSTKISELTQLRTSLVGAGFVSRSLDDNEYEIGFSLPESYLEIENTQAVLNELGDLLHALANAINKQQPLKIKYVSNGSLELYIQAAMDLAQHFDILLDYALKIYAGIQASKQIKDYIKKKFTNKSNKDGAEKLADADIKESTNKLIDEMIEALKLKNADDKNRVKGLFKRFLKHLEKGVSAEVRTPQIAEPKEPGEDATAEAKKEYKSAKLAFDTMQEIEQRNRSIFILQQNNFHGVNTSFLDDPGEKSD